MHAGLNLGKAGMVQICYLSANGAKPLSNACIVIAAACGRHQTQAQSVVGEEG